LPLGIGRFNLIIMKAMDSVTAVTPLNFWMQTISTKLLTSKKNFTRWLAGIVTRRCAGL
jgi:hypothetical protein